MSRRSDAYQQGVPQKSYDLIREGLLVLAVVVVVIVILAGGFQFAGLSHRHRPSSRHGSADRLPADVNRDPRRAEQPPRLRSPLYKRQRQRPTASSGSLRPPGSGSPTP